MNLLVVLANPKKSSYTRQLMDTFLTSYRSHHPADVITELDLYRQAALPVIDDSVLQAWAKPAGKLLPEEQHLLSGIDQYTDQFVAADKVVFAAPMWNLQFPPLLTAYLATIMVAGKTFAYTENGICGLVPTNPSCCCTFAAASIRPARCSHSITLSPSCAMCAPWSASAIFGRCCAKGRKCGRTRPAKSWTFPCGKRRNGPNIFDPAELG